METTLARDGGIVVEHSPNNPRVRSSTPAAATDTWGIVIGPRLSVIKLFIAVI
jgi:hypothetical protein